MPGTVRRIIDRIKEVRSGGNSVVALTVETRLVLQGFDPQRFNYDTPDDAARLARIRDVAAEMGVDVDDLLAAADTEPDASAAVPAPPGSAPRSAPTGTSTMGAGMGHSGGAPDVPSDHPLHAFREIADETLNKLDANTPAGARSGASFSQLVKASLLMALYSIGNDRVFCDQLLHNPLFRWFVGLAEKERNGFDAEAFAEDRQDALRSAAARAFFDRAVIQASRRKLFSSDVLQVNGRQIKGWMTPRNSA